MNILQPSSFYRLKLILTYILVKLKFLHPFLSKSTLKELPLGWNNHMFWVAFKSRGKKSFFDYYCELEKPSSYQPKVETEDKYKLNKEDIQQFYEKGYIEPFRVISPEKAAKVRKHLAYLATQTPSKIHKTEDLSFDKTTQISHKETSEDVKKFVRKRVNEFNRHLEDDVLLDLLTRPEIVERCAQLLGEDLQLWRSQFFPIAPKTKGTDWHQASTWLRVGAQEAILSPPNPRELFQVTVWIALSDTHKKKACLITLSNSQWKIHPYSLTKNKKKDVSVVFGEYEGKIDYEILPEDINYLEMKAGECVIFSERALHGSTDNKTDEWRWGVNARIVRPDTRVYTEKMLKQNTGTKVYGVSTMNIENWKAIQIRGKDDYGYNRVLQKEPVLNEE